MLERFEAGARAWSQRTGGSVVEVHGYAVAAAGLEAGSDGRPRVQTELEAALHRVYPETAAAGVLAEEWLVMADCPLVDTSPWALRPGVRTPDPRVLLAGDHVRCDLPVALMERAATTGFQAANVLLERWGLAGQELWTVPMRGLLSCLLTRCLASSPVPRKVVANNIDTPEKRVVGAHFPGISPGTLQVSIVSGIDVGTRQARKRATKEDVRPWL